MAFSKLLILLEYRPLLIAKLGYTTTQVLTLLKIADHEHEARKAQEATADEPAKPAQPHRPCSYSNGHLAFECGLKSEQSIIDTCTRARSHCFLIERRVSAISTVSREINLAAFEKYADELAELKHSNAILREGAKPDQCDTAWWDRLGKLLAEQGSVDTGDIDPLDLKVLKASLPHHTRLPISWYEPRDCACGDQQPQNDRVWSALKHDACLTRLSHLGDAPDGSPENREMLALAEKWQQEGGVPEGGWATGG